MAYLNLNAVPAWLRVVLIAACVSFLMNLGLSSDQAHQILKKIGVEEVESAKPAN